MNKNRSSTVTLLVHALYLFAAFSNIYIRSVVVVITVACRLIIITLNNLEQLTSQNY